MTLWFFALSFIFITLANAHTYSDQQLKSDLALIKKSTLQLLSQENDGSIVLLDNSESVSILNSIFSLCDISHSNHTIKTTLGKHFAIDLISCGESSANQIILITDKKRTEVLDLHFFQLSTSFVTSNNSFKLDVSSKYFFKADGVLNSDNTVFNLNGIKQELIRDIKSRQSAFFLISGITIENTTNFIKALFQKATHTVLERYASDYNDRLNQNFPLMHKNVSSQNLLSLDSLSFSVTFIFDNDGIELAD